MGENELVLNIKKRITKLKLSFFKIVVKCNMEPVTASQFLHFYMHLIKCGYQFILIYLICCKWDNSQEFSEPPKFFEMPNMNLLYDIGSSTWCSVTTWRGGMGCGVWGRFKRKGSCVCLWQIHIVVWQKPAQHCKAILQFLKKMPHF